MPLCTALIDVSINVVVFFAASALLLARLRTSSATTAKPFPAVPALAASTAAFNASIFVWNAISSIVLIIFPISLELALIFSIAWIIFCICSLLFSITVVTSVTCAFAIFVLCSFASTWLRISSVVATNSSTELACSVAPWDNVCAPVDTRSDSVATNIPAFCMPFTVLDITFWNASIACWISWNSPLNSHSVDTFKWPAAIISIVFLISFTYFSNSFTEKFNVFDNTPISLSEV